MRKLFNKILNPNFLVLLIYGLLSLVILTFFNLNASFGLFYTLYLYSHFIGLFIAIALGLIISFYIDKKGKTLLKRYFIISIIQLVVVWTIAEPFRNWQIERAQLKAEQIIKPLEQYKKKYKSYPETLEKLKEKLNIEIPTRTSLGTYYWYEFDNRNSYKLSFYSYYGYIASYNKEKKKWGFFD